MTRLKWVALVGFAIGVVPMIALVGASPAKPDLVVGYVEGSHQGVRVVYGNQGPGECLARTISLRLSHRDSSGKDHNVEELFTLDGQESPRKPFQVCRSQWIPWKTLGSAADREFAGLTVDIDPRNEVAEVNELNNDHFELVNGRVETMDVPNFEKYAGQPDLAIAAAEFVAPHSLRVTIVNRGKGITPVKYGVRFTAKGLKNDLRPSHRRFQPLPVAGQLIYEDFDFHRWGVKLGEKVPIVVELDPEGRVSDLDRSNNVVKKTLTFGPTGPLKLPVAQISGRVGGEPPFEPRSAFAMWVPEEETLSMTFLPFELTAADGDLVRLSDAEGLVNRRDKLTGKTTHFARLDLKFDHGVTKPDMARLVDARWWWATGTGGMSIAPDNDLKPTWKISAASFQAGENVSIDVRDRVAFFRAELRGQIPILARPRVALPDTKDRHLPQDVPPFSVRGSVQFRGKVFRPISVFARTDDKAEEVTLHFFEVPIPGEEVESLRNGNSGSLLAGLTLDKLAEVQVYFHRNEGYRSHSLGVCTKRAGLGGGDHAPQGGLIGQPGKGRSVKFKLKSVPGDSVTVDLEGSVTIAP